MKIRALDKKFWDKIFYWCSLEDFKVKSRLDVTPYTEQQILNEFASYTQNPSYRLFQVEKGDEAIGFVMLKNIDFVNRRCEFHVEIPEEQNRNHTIGYEVLLWVIDYAFNQLNMNKIKTSVLSNNPVVLGIMERLSDLGFVKEGVLYQEYYINGKYENLHLFSKGREPCQ